MSILEGSGPSKVSKLLNELQNDLVGIKSQASSVAITEGRSTALKQLQASIEKAEKNLRNNAEVVITARNAEVMSLPSLSLRQQKQQRILEEREKLLGLQEQQHAVMSLKPESLAGNSRIGPGRMGMAIREAQIFREPTHVSNRAVVLRNFYTKERLRRQNLQSENLVPPIGRTGKHAHGTLSWKKGRQHGVESYSRNAVPLTEHDARRGLLSLVERGKIPRDADLTEGFGVGSTQTLQQQPLSLHAREEQFFRAPILESTPMTMLKLDLSGSLARVRGGHHQLFSRVTTTDTNNVLALRNSSEMSGNNSSNVHDDMLAITHDVNEAGLALNTVEVDRSPTPVLLKHQHAVQFKEFEEKSSSLMPRGSPLSPLKSRDNEDSCGENMGSTFNISTMSTKSDDGHVTDVAKEHLDVAGKYNFTIRRGTVISDTPEYVSFHLTYSDIWGTLLTYITRLCLCFNEYAVPFAVINGEKLTDIAMKHVVSVPSRDELLGTAVNFDEVMKIIKRPGRRFRGYRGRVAAVVKIQATVRMHQEKLRFKQLLLRKWAVGIFERSWILLTYLRQTLNNIAERRAQRLVAYEEISNNFKEIWMKQREKKRIVVHIPSLSFAEHIRQGIDNFHTAENEQMARLCEVQDKLVDILYISPVPLDDAALQYYQKLLSMTGIRLIADRYKIITPENIGIFSSQMSLTDVLLYSPKALRRIHNFVRGRLAYIVPGVVGRSEIHLAIELGCPILGAHLEASTAFGSKSGARVLLESAQIPVPPGNRISGDSDTFMEKLAMLIAANIQRTSTWVLKMNHEYCGRGHAYFDARKLACYNLLLTEYQRSSKLWFSNRVQEQAIEQIMTELSMMLPRIAVLAEPKVYKTWHGFFALLMQYGCTIEACPERNESTTLVVDILIEPSGGYRIVSTCDLVLSSPFVVWGATYPQCSVPVSRLQRVVSRIVSKCIEQRIIGYVSIDLVTFSVGPSFEDAPESLTWEPLEPQINVVAEVEDGIALWATGVKLSYSPFIALSRLMSFLTMSGEYNEKSGLFNAGVSDEVSESRFAVASTRLLHSNLSIVHYSVFFNMCRASGISMNVKEKSGAVFMLLDSFTKGTIGMMVVAKTLPEALMVYCHNLTVIHQALSSPSMPGVNNFSVIVAQLQEIIRHTSIPQNEEGRLQITEIDSAEENYDDACDAFKKYNNSLSFRFQ